MSTDIYSILQDYDAKQQEEKDKSMAEQLTDAVSENMSKQKALRDMAKHNREEKEESEDIDKHREIELGSGKLDIQSIEYQEKLAKKIYNAFTLPNVQKMIRMNKQNTQRGMNKEYTANMYAGKNVPKTQTSRVDIPTHLLNKIMSEIGNVPFRITNDLAITGFLYWYYNIPVGNEFDADKQNKVQEIVDTLNLEASPSQTMQANKSMLDSLANDMVDLKTMVDSLKNGVDAINTTTSRMQPDIMKVKMAIFYNILNMLAFTPPIMPNDKLGDIDFLANGYTWDISDAFDHAFSYYEKSNGRDIYKNKIRQKMNQYEYTKIKSFSNEYPQEQHVDHPVQQVYADEVYEDIDTSDIDVNMFDIYEVNTDRESMVKMNAVEKAQYRKRTKDAFKVNTSNDVAASEDGFDPYAFDYEDDYDEDSNNDDE